MGSDAKMTPVSLLNVQARWGYSEIIDSTVSHCYNGSDIPSLRATEANSDFKLRGGIVTISRLTSPEAT